MKLTRKMNVCNLKLGNVRETGKLPFTEHRIHVMHYNCKMPTGYPRSIEYKVIKLNSKMLNQFNSVE